jgi:predicted RNA-binding Zn-ribbon protein involved in translation (DUF1610 family)
MGTNKKLKGTFGQRFSTILLSLVLGVLLFWLLSFVTDDIGSLRGPDFSKVRAQYVDKTLVGQQKSLKEKLGSIKKNVRNQKELRDILKDSTNNLQNTINQLLSIQKQSIEKNLNFSEENQQTLIESQSVFLDNQRQYQALSQQIAELTKQQRQLEKDLAVVSKQIDEQQKLAQTEYNKLMKRHRLKIAALKLAALVPVFLIAAWLFIKKRSTTYGPIIYATFIAVFLKLSFVIHEHFPTKYLKYIGLLVIIGIVLRLLVYLLKRIVSPKKDRLIKLYQESYDKNVCGICGKPIRIGPLRYATAGKRKAMILTAGQGTEAFEQYVYVCPSCGTELYQKCEKCSEIRHSLLPFCEHCGNEKINWIQ